MPRRRRGNWDNDFQNNSRIRNGIPEERRQLLIDRGIIENDSVEELDNNTFELSLNELNLRAETLELNNGSVITTLPNGVGQYTVRGGRSNQRIFDMNYVVGWDVNSSFNTIENQYKYIHSFNYKPNKFKFNSIHGETDLLYMGFELEIDKGGKSDENAKLVIDMLGEDNIYCKHDGSLDNGFEIVTHPATLDYHYNMNYEEMMKKLIELDYKSHDTTTCGLHIHFNKNYFSENKTIQDLNITKLLYLFEKYWDNVEKFSRRSSGYAQRYYIKLDDSMFDVLSKAKNAYNKYYAINLRNEDTVEIRTFKGTLKYNTLIATLQFVNRIVKICKNTDLLEIQNVTWEDIIANPEKELKQYLIERKMLEEILVKSA